ncbi:jg14822 [Pararge aegeria aegeria]|uniref:Jg14822 protein n=1 Tax=Pararge aegeria aegeria TaxID=348720 RepID=A0A8S4QUW4_9NEOP|nr:jg14822 [Pararge aegeria aegeria]
MELNSENEDLPQNIETKYPLLQFEKQIFIDIFEKDALVIIAKGLSYNAVVANLLWVHKDPGNLVLVLNSSDHEEKLFTEKFRLTVLPNTGAEREKAYLEGGVYFVSTRILVVDLLKNRVPVSNITGIVVLRAHTVLESCQEAFVLRLFRQKNKIGFIKAFSNSPISFTFGYHQVEKVMRALFVTELFLWPRFHGAIIKSLKSRQAEVIELHVRLTTNTSLIQSCLLDIMNYTVKQLKSINRTLDMQVTLFIKLSNHGKFQSIFLLYNG